MASKVHSENGTAAETVTEFKIRATDAVETERTVEAPLENAVELLDGHLIVNELTPAAGMTIPKNVRPSIDSKVHSGNGAAAETPEIEMPPTATVETVHMVRAEVKEAPEKESNSGADHPTFTEKTTIPKNKWPGDCVFRVIVPAVKLESIIGPNGDLIKKMCEETKADIHVLEGPACTPKRIVCISGKEDIEAPLSPAMDAVIRVFKHVNGFPENESDVVTLASVPFCLIRLLVTSTQATTLIGNQESRIKEIQEKTGCFVIVRNLSCVEVSTLSANSDDRVVDLHGEALKVLKALEAVLKHLRMFLVDHTKEKHKFTTTEEKHQVIAWAEKSMVDTNTNPQRGSLFLPHKESQFSSSAMRSIFGLDPQLSTTCGPGFGPSAGPVTKDNATTTQGKHIWAEKSVVHTDTHPQRESWFSSSRHFSFGLDPTKCSPPGSSHIAAPSVTQALTGPCFLGPALRSKRCRQRKKQSCPTLPPYHVTATSSGRISNKPLVVPSAAIKIPEGEPMVFNFSSVVEVPPVLPQVQPAVETKADVAVSTDEVAMQMEVEESLVPDRAFSLPVRNFFGNPLIFPRDIFGPGKGQCGPPLSNRTTLCLESMQEAKRSRVSWENMQVVKTFLDACIHEITINGRESGTLNPMSWKKVGEMLKDRHNFSVDDKQLKDYFDDLKSKYSAWLLLKNKTNNIYHPSTNTFNLTDKEWETEIEENKCIETLRNAPLPFPNLCAQLFDGAISAGATEAPVQPKPIMCSSLAEVPPELPHVQPASEIVAIGTKRLMSVFEEEILGVLKMIAEKMNKPEPPPKPTFEDCENKLNELGWPKHDLLNLIALTIFCDENDRYRELWMKLQPERCADWVRMIGRSKRFT